jgi:tetratricopeptide (TPR) repeat protein
MKSKRHRIGSFRVSLFLIAAFIGIAPCMFPKKAVALPDKATAQPAASIAESDELPLYMRGLFLDMKENFEGAIASFRKVMAFRPADPAVRYSISKAYYRLGKLDSARVYCEAAVRLDPSNRHYLRYLAGVYHDMRDYNRAAELYGQDSLLEPERAEILYLQGLEYITAKRPEMALEVFEKAVRIDPYNENALAQTLVLEVGLKRYAAAIDTVKQLLALRGSDLKLGFTLADLYTKIGKNELALQTLRELIEANRGNISARIALFDHFIESGHADDFHRELVAFLDKEPPTKASLRDFARLYVSRSQKDSLYVGPALVVIDEAIARHPRDSELFILKGMYGLMHDRRQEVLASLSKAVQLDSGNASAWEYLITANYDLGEKRKAFDLLPQARRRLPAERLRWNAVEGYLLLSSHAPKRAAALLETVVQTKKKPHDTEMLIQANINLAMAYDQLGMKQRCRSAYERVLVLDAHNTLAMNNLAYMFAEQGVMLQRALRLAGNAVMLEPDNAVYLDTYGWVHYKLGNYELARQALEKAVATGIDEAEVYRHLGEAYRKLGLDDKAKEMLEKARNVKK